MTPLRAESPGAEAHSRLWRAGLLNQTGPMGPVRDRHPLAPLVSRMLGVAQWQSACLWHRWLPVRIRLPNPIANDHHNKCADPSVQIGHRPPLEAWPRWLKALAWRARVGETWRVRSNRTASAPGETSRLATAPASKAGELIRPCAFNSRSLRLRRKGFCANSSNGRAADL